MTTVRKEYSATDAQPIVLYAKKNADSQQSYPVLIDNFGSLITSGLIPFSYDAIALTYSGNNITVVQYYVGGTSGTLVSTLTLSYSGNNITSVVRT